MLLLEGKKGKKQRSVAAAFVLNIANVVLIGLL